MNTPIIESLSTNIGPVGQWVYLAGNNFIENETKVFFGSIECPIAFYAAVSIGLSIPEGSSGENAFKVVTPDGEFISDIVFTVGVPSAPPTVTSFINHSNPLENCVYVAGTNFVGGQTLISYNGKTATANAYVYSPESCGFAKENIEDVITSITLTTPNGAATFSS